MDTDDLEKLEYINELKEEGLLSENEFAKLRENLQNFDNENLARLHKLHEMKDKGLLSENEFKTEIKNLKVKMGIKMSDRRQVVFLLCLLGGLIGIHRFYTGYRIIGLLYFFTGAFYGIGWLIDLALIWHGEYKDADGEYV